MAIGTSWISDWNPEDQKFWESKGKFIARRNLIWSIFAEHLGFSIWLIWSIVATKLPLAGFHYTTDQLFQLVALPGLIGSLMRFPYTFVVVTFGGRNWTIFSASVLFIPVLALSYFVTKPDTPFWLMLLVAAAAGLGGGNFASSMTNISFFYPDRMKGWALGLNAAGGNIGVRRSLSGPGDLPHLLRDLPRADLVVLPAYGAVDLGRLESRASAGVRNSR